MRLKPPSPVLLEWIAVSLRWLVLLALALSLAMRMTLTGEIELVFLMAALWNMILSGLSALNRPSPALRYGSVAVDLLVVYLLYSLSSGSQGNLAWTGLLILYLAMGALLGFLVQRMRLTSIEKQRSDGQARREAEKTGSERRRAIYELISTLSATLNYQRVLDSALDLAARGLAGPEWRSDGMVSAVLLYSPGEAGSAELRVGSARRFTPADLRIGLPGVGGLLGRSIDSGEPRLAKAPAGDPELSKIVALRACESVYCIPLRTGLDTCGVLLFAHPDPEYFTSDRREILDIIGSQATIALQNARLYRDLEQEKERMTEIQEEARKKLARDLHDGPTQSVAALAMRANFARRLMDRDPKAAADELFKIEDLARRTTKEIRHMLFTLRPLVLETQGLVAALESMAEKMQETYNQNVVIEAGPGVIDQMEPGKQGVVFYIAEEAVNNARKHAKAPHVWVRLKLAGEELVSLEVKDDGVGFEVGSLDVNYEGRGSLGMVNMRERAELLNGLLQLDSAPGCGTSVNLLIPLSEEAADRLRRGL